MESLKEKLSFWIKFLKNPKENASIVPSSKYLSKAMIDWIDFSKIHTIVELWPWTWVFTKEIIKKAKKNTKIILIETEKNYVDLLKKKFKNIVIIENDSAENLNKIIIKHKIDKIDLIVSWLPYTIPKNVLDNILLSIWWHVSSWTTFRFFTYIPPVMKKYYKCLPIKRKKFVMRNFPPAWIYWIN